MAGNDISKTNRLAGVMQASPGIKYTADSRPLLTKDNESVLQLKMYDDPVQNSNNKGVVKIVLLTNAYTGNILPPVG